jgi:hypothetical protein
VKTPSPYAFAMGDKMNTVIMNFSDNGFVYDPNTPTLQTERLSYMLANALNGQITTQTSLGETELTAYMVDVNNQPAYWATIHNDFIGIANKISPAQVSELVTAINALVDAILKEEIVRGEETFIGLAARLDDIGADIAAATGIYLDSPGQTVVYEKEIETVQE